MMLFNSDNYLRRNDFCGNGKTSRFFPFARLSYAQILASVKSRFQGGFSSDSTGEFF